MQRAGTNKLNGFFSGLENAGRRQRGELRRDYIRTNAPFRRLFALTAIIPNVVPNFLITIAWVLLAVLEGLVFIPWGVPGTALALGLLWVYVDFPIPVYATISIILIGYITRLLPYGLRAVSSTVRQIHNQLEDASTVCGAGFPATFRSVLMPLIRPGVIAGWLILATILREFSIAIFFYSGRHASRRPAIIPA